MPMSIVCSRTSYSQTQKLRLLLKLFSSHDEFDSANHAELAMLQQ